MLPGDGSVKCLSTSGFNKSVMTFDGLISACVWFLKMAREETGKGEGKGGGVKHPPSRRQGIGGPLFVDPLPVSALIPICVGGRGHFLFWMATPLTCYLGSLCRLSHRLVQQRHRSGCLPCRRRLNSPFHRKVGLPGPPFPSVIEPLHFH